MTKIDNDRVLIFDTTLRDGAQAVPEDDSAEDGKSPVGIRERQAITNGLIELGVDAIEAGFATSSDEDFEGIQYAAEKTKGTGIYVASLTTANKTHIDHAWDAVKDADNPMIHTFISTSPIHMEKKLGMTPNQTYEKAVEAVRYAKELMGGKGHVEFSAEDASRTDPEFLSKIVLGTLAAGADRINLPDTVGYAQPGEVGQMIRNTIQNVPELEQSIISVHNHNDLGLATYNSIEGIMNGARQVECTVNGVGERAGNAAVEEIAAALVTRKDYYGNLHTGIKTENLGSISRLVSELFRMSVQPNKAIVGSNAFAHRSGIHQDGVDKERTTYEIMDPEMFGWSGENFALNKNSGRRGFKRVLEEMGFNANDEEVTKVYQFVMDHATKYGANIDPRVVACVLTDHVRGLEEKYSLKHMNVRTATNRTPNASVNLEYQGKLLKGNATAKGPISALYDSIDNAVNGDGREMRIEDFVVRSLGNDRNSVGETVIKVQADDKIVYGWGLSHDIVKSAAKAYISALNKF